MRNYFLIVGFGLLAFTLAVLLAGCVAPKAVEITPELSSAIQNHFDQAAAQQEVVNQQAAVAVGKVQADVALLRQSAGRDINNPWPMVVLACFVAVIGAGLFVFLICRFLDWQQARKAKGLAIEKIKLSLARTAKPLVNGEEEYAGKIGA
jgi:hypothetical protein